MIRKINGSIRNKVYIESTSTKQYIFGFWCLANLYIFNFNIYQN